MSAGLLEHARWKRIFFNRSMHNQALYGDGVYQRSKIAETMIGRI